MFPSTEDIQAARKAYIMDWANDKGRGLLARTITLFILGGVAIGVSALFELWFKSAPAWIPGVLYATGILLTVFALMSVTELALSWSYHRWLAWAYSPGAVRTNLTIDQYYAAWRKVRYPSHRSSHNGWQSLSYEALQHFYREKLVCELRFEAARKAQKISMDEVLLNKDLSGPKLQLEQKLRADIEEARSFDLHSLPQST